MSYFKQLDDVSSREILPGFHGKLLHGEKVTVVNWEIRAGSELPHHHHIHEQVSYVISGEFEMTIGEETRTCRAGDVAVIPSNVPHSGKALTDCVIFDVFQPVREEYK
jgi:quercetin dioxygenase-like cupin family protein